MRRYTGLFVLATWFVGNSLHAQEPSEPPPEAAPDSPTQGEPVPSDEAPPAPEQPVSVPIERAEPPVSDDDPNLEVVELGEDDDPNLEVVELEEEQPVPVEELGTSVTDDQPDTIDVTIAGTTLARTAGSAHILTPKQLERFEYDDAHAALLQVPGVYVRQEDGVGLRPNISLRGANPDRSKKVTLMEDGVLSGPAPYTAPAAYYFPVLTRMTNLRVIKGPSTVAHGPHTVGGAIDMVTRAVPSQVEAELDLGVGQYGYRKAHGYFGASTENVGFLVEGVRLHTDGFKQLDGGGDTGFTRNEWMVKASYVVDPVADKLHTFRVKLGYSDEASNETYLGLTDEDFRETPNRRYAASSLDRMDFYRTQALVSHELEVPDRDLKLTTTAYRNDFDRVWRKFNSFEDPRVSVPDVLADPTGANAEYYAVLTGQRDSAGAGTRLAIGPNDRTFISEGVQSVLLGSLVTGAFGHRFEAGLRLHYDSIVRRHSETAYDMVDGELFPHGGPTVMTTANHAHTTALAAHVIDAITYRHLTLTPGLRVEALWTKFTDDLFFVSNDAQTTVALPGLGIFYEFVDGLGVLAGAHRGFSPAPPGEPDVKPEMSVNYEAGARYSKGRARAEAIGFFNDYSNLTNVCTFSSGCNDNALDVQADAGAAFVYGLEMYAEYEPSLGVWAFPLSAAYTFTRSEFRTSFTSRDPMWGMVQKGDELPYIPRHLANTTASVEHPRASFSTSFTYVAPMNEGVGAQPLDKNVHTDKLFVLDLGGSVTVTQGIRVYANLRNATNYHAIVSRRPYGARPNAPLWFQAGIKGEI